VISRRSMDLIVVTNVRAWRRRQRARSFLDQTDRALGSNRISCAARVDAVRSNDISNRGRRRFQQSDAFDSEKEW